MDNSNTAKITVYKTSWCAFCHAEMEWLDKLGVPYVAKDIEADKSAYDELMSKTGGSFSGVPVTDIAGDMILGFDRPRLQDAINRHEITAAA